MKTPKFESFPEKSPEQPKEQVEKPEQPEKPAQPKEQKELTAPFSPETEAELKGSQILESEKSYRQKLKEKIEDAKKKSQGYFGSFLKQQLNSAEKRESDLKNLLRNLMDYQGKPKQRKEIKNLIKLIKAGYLNELNRLKTKRKNLQHNLKEGFVEKIVGESNMKSIQEDTDSIKESLVKFKTEVLDPMADLGVVSKKQTKVAKLFQGKKMK